MRLVALTVSGLLLAVRGLGAQGAAAGAAVEYESFTLPNGLRVIYSEDHTTPIVTVDLWYDVGSRNERPGRSGFAHLFEHLMFEGWPTPRKDCTRT